MGAVVPFYVLANLKKKFLYIYTHTYNAIKDPLP